MTTSTFGIYSKAQIDQLLATKATPAQIAAAIAAIPASSSSSRFSALPGQPVATASSGIPLAQGVGTVSTGYSARNVYKIAVDCTDIQVVFPIGYFLNSGGALAETALGTQTTGFKASLETSSGGLYALNFRGVRLGTIDPFGMIVSDPIAVELKAGDVVYVKSFVPATSSNGESWVSAPTGYGPGITYTNTIGQNATGDYTDSLTVQTYANGASLAYDTGIICGVPTGVRKPVVAVIGDSISVGMGSTNNSFSWWKYGLTNSFPTIQWCRSGIAAQGVAAAHQRSFPLLQGANYALCLLGTNDYRGRTVAQLQADILTVWNALANRGMKLTAATLPPGTTSTDAWATTANQTINTAEATRIGYNTWVRAGSPIDPTTKAAVAAGTSGALVAGSTGHPLSTLATGGYLDFADVTESARNSGYWKVTGAANYGTSDGVHPSDAMHQAMGALVTTLSASFV